MTWSPSKDVARLEILEGFQTPRSEVSLGFWIRFLGEESHYNKVW